MNYFLLIIGFVLLTYSANFLVDGASAIAKRLHVSHLVIGLTVVAFGTSAPELVVNLTAVYRGNSEIAFTNILGSNTINTLVILGVSSLIYPLAAQKSTLRVELPLSILSGLLVLIMGMNYFSLSEGTGLSRANGIILLLIFAGFLFYTFRLTKRQNQNNGAPQEEAAIKDMKPLKALIYVVGGLIGLVAGGHYIVKSAVAIASAWGVSESVIGATIVALGTSLPELATSAMAAHKKNADIAIGNVIGSNIFNVFLILGTSATLRPMPAYANLATDAAMVVNSSLLVLVFLLVGKKHLLQRWQGAVLLLFYVGYLFILLR